MARGANAKIEVENIIRNAFGDRFLGTADKKLYVKANDGDEMVDVAITLTCPKVPFSASNPVGEGGMDFENVPTNGVTAPTEFKPAEITKEETENIRKLLAELGL